MYFSLLKVFTNFNFTVLISFKYIKQCKISTYLYLVIIALSGSNCSTFIFNF